MEREVNILIIAGVYLMVIAFSTGILKFFKRQISFLKTAGHALIAALVTNVISYFLWPVLISPGYFWGEIPASTLIFGVIIVSLPVIVISLTMLWSAKRQLNTEKSNRT